MSVPWFPQPGDIVSHPEYGVGRPMFQVRGAHNNQCRVLFECGSRLVHVEQLTLQDFTPKD